MTVIPRGGQRRGEVYAELIGKGVSPEAIAATYGVKTRSVEIGAQRYIRSAGGKRNVSSRAKPPLDTTSGYKTVTVSARQKTFYERFGVEEIQAGITSLELHPELQVFRGIDSDGTAQVIAPFLDDALVERVDRINEKTGRVGRSAIIRCAIDTRIRQKGLWSQYGRPEGVSAPLNHIPSKTVFRNGSPANDCISLQLAVKQLITDKFLQPNYSELIRDAIDALPPTDEEALMILPQFAELRQIPGHTTVQQTSILLEKGQKDRFVHLSQNPEFGDNKSRLAAVLLIWRYDLIDTVDTVARRWLAVIQGYEEPTDRDIQSFRQRGFIEPLRRGKPLRSGSPWKVGA